MYLAEQTDNTIWRLSAPMYAVAAVAAVTLLIIFYDGIEWLVSMWIRKEEYGYAFGIPAVTAFLIWQRRDRLERIPFEGSWVGVIVLVLGLLGFVLGELSALYVVMQYALVIALVGCVVAAMGLRATRLIAVPLLLLVFMIPLPQFLYNSVSGQLQLLSSQIGVEIIRLVGISVYLEGNVIDLGGYRLQVVEACSGLRYLFPLASLAFISAYLFSAPLWKRVVVVLSSVPITILMNSLRIGIIGVLVEYNGVAAAEGFLHDFEGWAVFMACMVVLVAEMWLLARVGSDRKPLREVFGLDGPAPSPAGAVVRRRKVGAPLAASGIVLILVAMLKPWVSERQEIVPARSDFAQFPAEIGGWTGKVGRLDAIYVDALKFDDYLLADFSDAQRRPINLYIAYYASQRKGESVHSPRSCIPGDGWEITGLTQQAVDGASVGGVPITVNRVIIRKGDAAQLVYYWFQQRGRAITNEYLVKWYLFWDSLTRNRTDGGLVRVTTPVDAGENLTDVDRHMEKFVRELSGRLGEFIPG